MSCFGLALLVDGGFGGGAFRRRVGVVLEPPWYGKQVRPEVAHGEGPH